MLEYLWYNWRDGYASVVATVWEVSLIVFHYGKNKPRAKLLGHKQVTQHHVKEMHQSLKQRKWCIKKCSELIESSSADFSFFIEKVASRTFSSVILWLMQSQFARCSEENFWYCSEKSFLSPDTFCSLFGWAFFWKFVLKISAIFSWDTHPSTIGERWLLFLE